MTVQHKDIPDGQIHEPKGITSAGLGNVYSSTGTGTGTWKRITSDMLSGSSGDLGVAGKKVVSNGSNGFNLVADGVYGSMTVTGNTNSFAMTAATDPTLNTNSDYALFTGTGAPWISENLSGVTFVTDRLIVPNNGVYRVDLWSTITAFPTNTAKLSVKHRINGGTFSARHPMIKSNSAGDSGNLNGFGYVTLNANDYLQLYVASSANGGVVFSDVNVILSLVKALP